MIQVNQGLELMDGSMFSYADPDVSNVTVQMLAHVLSQINRFAGHTSSPYSVAQHCVNVSLIVEKGHELDALLHDTAEAFINDFPTPLKFMLPNLKEIEVRIETRLAEKFGTTFPLSPEVKLADTQMLGIEKAILKPSASEWAILDGVKYNHLYGLTQMQSMEPWQARDLFLDRYLELTR